MFSSPLLISIPETCYQLSVEKSVVRSLIDSGELLSLVVAGRELVVAESLRAFAKRETRRRTVERRGAVAADESSKKAAIA